MFPQSEDISISDNVIDAYGKMAIKHPAAHNRRCTGCIKSFSKVSSTAMNKKYKKFIHEYYKIILQNYA